MHAPYPVPARPARGFSGVECETLKAGEVAKLLGVGRDTVYEAARKNEIPGAIRLGRRLVFSRARVLAWLGNEPSSED